MINQYTRDAMARTAEQSMMDLCVRLKYTPQTNSDGREIEPTFPEAEPFKCGYQPKGSRDTKTGLVLTDDRLRLPLNAADVFNSRDRIKITHRHGEELVEPIVRALQGDLKVGVSACLVALKGVHS